MGKVKVIERDEVVVRFSGDSGDGMQFTGTLFSDTSAQLGNDISTFPDYPAEIRAPQGTVGGVSGFQVHFGHSIVYTPGDYADVLVAMNPAALKANRDFIKQGGTIIFDKDAFDKRNILKAGYHENPFIEEKLQNFNLIEAPITTLTQNSLKEMGLSNKDVLRCRNMYALGMVYRLFERPLTHTQNFIRKKFAKNEKLVEANIKILREGYNYAVTIEALTPYYHVSPAKIEPGVYRNINGNLALTYGLLAASEKSGRELFLGSYPITPASEILQYLSGRKDLGVKVFQAEDEIAGICTAIGASYAGSLAITSTSGPGLALKGEALGLAVITELPLVVINVQRGGPSTGLPTKTEQSDLLQALYGRNGESPLVVMAASTPSDCFNFAFEACRIAVEHMTPVILLSDGYLANGSQSWKIPDLEKLPPIRSKKPKKTDGAWSPYERDDVTLTRPWACPGTKGFEHRIGGLEKDYATGNVSYSAENHELMVKTRQKKINAVSNFIPELKLYGEEDAELLVVGWGGTYGHLLNAVDEMQQEGYSIALAHFNYIKPLPKNTAEILEKFDKIVVCELNLGQFIGYLRMLHPGINFTQYNKVQGLPFTVIELKKHFIHLLKDN